MRYQEREYSCGPASVRAVLHLHGIEATEACLRKLCKTTKDGTTETGISSGMSYFGFKTKDFTYKTQSRAWKEITTQLNSGMPVIICTDRWKHWCCVIGVIGEGVLLYDPTEMFDRKTDFSSVHFYSKKKFFSRWGYRHGKDKLYYGLVFSKE